MKLYYSKGACSLAPHIVFEELGLPYEAISVNLTQPPTSEFLKVNPMGAVPVLIMDNGQALTEDAVILQYLADQKPDSGLAPRAGTLERYRLQEWLNFIATEIHKGFGPLWAVDAMSQNDATQTEIRAFALADLGRKFDVIVQKMGNQEFLLPSGYSIADAYLFTILNWTFFMKMDLSRWPVLDAYVKRVRSRPAVLRTLKAEHLM